MRRFHSWEVIAFGGYLVLLGIHYATLLLHAVVMVREAGWGTLISTVLATLTQPALGGPFGSGFLVRFMDLLRGVLSIAPGFLHRIFGLIDYPFVG